MKCPECQNEMNQICMYGTDDDINIDWHCERCGTLATLHWTPSKRKIANNNNDLPY